VQDWSYLTYTPWDTTTPCGIGTDRYYCGAPISVVYWTLSHNKVRVGYGQHPSSHVAAGSEILDQSIYKTDAGQLANIVFSYAIATLPDDSTVQDFFNRVSERYYNFELEGVINSGERHRVNQAIAVHCVGWSGWICNSPDWHRTAWQRRPAAYTAKSNFNTNGFNEEFVRAETMTRIGTPTPVSFGTSGDGYGYIILDSTGDEICANLYFTSTGNYQFHAAVRAPSASHDQVLAKIGSNPYGDPWDVTDISHNTWIWSHNGPVLPVQTAGTNSVCLKRYSTENLQIDAILIRKVP
jgi:hypothetical protein